MSKISLEEVESTLLKKKVDSKVVTEIIKELNEVIEEIKKDKVTLPKTKNEFVFILKDDTGELKGKELTGWVVQIPQGDDPATILDKLKAAAADTDSARKRRKGEPMQTLTAAFAGIKRAF